jgi:hypothetical protein
MTQSRSRLDKAWDDLLRCAEKYARVLRKSEREWVKDAKDKLDEAIVGLKKAMGEEPPKKAGSKKIKKTRRKSS